jgi:intein-encoded DNA endonuclease-like protein
MPILKKKNEHFFKTWSPEMAYVLGFFAADGCMIRNNRGAYFIEFYNTDRGILEEIKEVLGSDHIISGRKRGEKWKVIYRLQIGSKEMFEDLLYLGMTPNKSKTLRMPDVPGKYFGDFTRGYFDGDGNAYANEYRRKDRNELSVTLLTGFTCGSRNFLEALHLRLKESAGISGGSLFSRESYFRLHFSVRDSCKLYAFMYNTRSDLFLRRKRDIFEGYFRKRGIIVAK